MDSNNVPKQRARKGRGGNQNFQKGNREPTSSSLRYFDISVERGPESKNSSLMPESVPRRKSGYASTFDGTTDFIPFDTTEDSEKQPGKKRRSRKRGRVDEEPTKEKIVQKELKIVDVGDSQVDGAPTESTEQIQTDPFYGPVRIPADKLKKFDRGPRMETNGIRTFFHQKEQKAREKKLSFSKLQAARQEILKAENYGLLEADDPLEKTERISQKEIVKSVDLQSQSKSFDLHLKEFGPYGFQYTRNGRHLLLYGKQGHIAAIDWVTKKLACEMNVQERISCCQWLHQETLYAVGQKQYLHIYDNNNTEIHCVKKISQVSAMDFLPYHFLLATGSERGFLTWLDVSVGQMVAQFNTKSGRLPILRKNPTSGVVHLGHSNGTVSLWSPNIQEPLVKFLSHQSPVRALDIDQTGNYMATAASDRKIKIWDLRNYQTVQEIQVSHAPTSLSFSQRGLLAVGMERHIQIFKDVGRNHDAHLYMQHFIKSGLQQVGFCPYEDVLGCGYSEGFSSLLIPGAGEAHFDAHEANPFQTKRQRQEMEVRALLEKIPADLIALDPSQIAQIHEPSLQEALETKARTLFVSVPKVQFTPKFKSAGGANSWTRRKATVQEEKKRSQIKEAVRARKHLLQMEKEDNKEVTVEKPKSIFDRFIQRET